jgi:centromeric protein E
MYDEVCASIMAGAFDGYNGTIFCYGQTASGKTHTMIGSTRDPGVTILGVHDVFDSISRTSTTDFLVYISFLEIYNEKIRDLLIFQEAQPASTKGRGFTFGGETGEEDDAPGLEVFEDKQRGPQVKGITEVVCVTPENVLELITMGLEARHVSATEMNQQSSRGMLSACQVWDMI